MTYFIFFIAIPLAIWLIFKSRIKLKKMVEAEPGAIYNETYNLVSV